MPLDASEAWVKTHGEAVDVSDTLAGKLLGADRTIAMTLFVVSHPRLAILFHILFYVPVCLFLPWLMRLVPDAAFLATIPSYIIYPGHLYLTASLTTVRALLTSFDVLYVFLLGLSGLVAMCDILRWEGTRAFIILGFVLPFGVGIIVLIDAMAPEVERIAGAQALKFGSFAGSVFFASIPLFFFFDLVPDVEVNQYKLADIGGREVTFSTFSVMSSSLTTVGLFCARWGFSALKYPHNFIVLRGPLLKQTAFNNKASRVADT